MRMVILFVMMKCQMRTLGEAGGVSLECHYGLRMSEDDINIACIIIDCFADSVRADS